MADGPEPSVGLYWFEAVDPTIAPGVQAPLWQLLIRTDTTPNELYWKSGEPATSWTLIGGGGGGGGGDPQAFRYTATGAEGSDFFITLPSARSSDSYRVQGTPSGMAMIVGLDFPDLIAADRTTLHFRCVTTSALTAGDQIDLYVCDVL